MSLDAVVIHPAFLLDVLADSRKAMAEFEATMRRFTGILDTSQAELDALRERFLDLATRPHRSGHRHRGTPDWRLRYAPGRKDLPLGLRTAAKR